MKRLALSFLMALAVHAFLFQAELPLAKPVLPSPQSRSVSINLVAVIKRAPQPAPAIPAPEPPPPPKPEPQPLKPPLPKVPAPVKPYVPAVKTMAAVEPLAPLETVPEASAREQRQPLPEEDAVAAEEAPAAGAPGPASDNAEVILSVPRYDLNPPFEYPQLARRRHWEGTVILDVLVDETGSVAELNVARSSGHSLLDRNALSQVKNWHFEPARKGGQAVTMWVEVPVRYQLK